MSVKTPPIASTQTTQTTTPAPAKRKAARLPPVMDRAGVTLDASTFPGATAAVSLAMPGATVAAPAPVAASAPAKAPLPAPASPPPTTPAAPPSPAPPAPGAGNPAAIHPSTVPFSNAPPTVSIPVPPAGFVPVRAVDLKGYRPMQSELASVPDAVAELQSFPNWSLIFGITAPPSTQVGQRLQVAAQWTSLLAQSNSWTSYVKSMEGMAWKDALEVMDSLKVPFQLASAASPSMLSQYPALTRLLGAQKVVAKRAVSTKKKNAAAASAATTTAATAAAAPAVATAAPETPPRVVTVQG